MTASACTGGVNDVGRLKSGMAFLPYGKFGDDPGGGGGAALALKSAESSYSKESDVGAALTSASKKVDRTANDFMIVVFENDD